MRRRPLRKWRVTYGRVFIHVIARSAGNAVAKAWRLLHREWRAEAAKRPDERELLKRLPRLKTDRESGGWEGISVAIVG